MNILTSGRTEQRAVMVDEANAHEYQAAIPINPLFKPLFMAVYQLSPELKGLNVHVVHDMTPEENERLSQVDVGVFEAKIDLWTLTLNWTEEKRDNLPPDYIGVDYGDVSCGIIGKYLTIRTCWQCGMTGWRNPERTIGCVEASYYEGDVWISRSCPNCHQTDWWANTIEPSRCHRDCAAAITSSTGRGKLWTAFGGKQMDELIAEEKGSIA